jgi:predicted ATPase
VRYRLLETLRQYAQERLDAADASAAARRHARYFLGLVERADARFLAGDEAGALRRIEPSTPRCGAERSFGRAGRPLLVAATGRAPASLSPGGHQDAPPLRPGAHRLTRAGGRAGDRGRGWRRRR